MQIDFHYNVVYILCRSVGYNENISLRIARASQYVDDSTEPGKVKNISKIITAHKMFNHSNLRIEDQIKIWLPFHFPPGFKGNNLFDKSIVREDSFSINQMLKSLQTKKEEDYFPEYLGIFLHVLADNYSHQGFSSFLSDRNDLSLINGRQPFKWINFLPDFIKNYIFMLMRFLPVGHLTVNTNPDLPYRKWSYKTGRMLQECFINNPERFKSAVDKIKEVLISYCSATSRKEDADLQKTVNKIKNQLESVYNSNPKKRHNIWQEKIKSGYFDLIPESNIDYSGQQLENDTKFLYNFHQAASEYKNYFHANITNKLFQLGLDDRIQRSANE
jgi:FtsZ-binding cell division protein ZapB